MNMTVEKDALIQFKQRHEFESTGFYQCNIVPLSNRSWKKSFSRRYNKLEAIVFRGWFHLYSRQLKDPVVLEKIRLDDEQPGNQREPTLQTNHPIPACISTYNLKIVIEITSLPNLPSALSLDLNTSEVSDSELATDYFHMIQKNDQVKDKYKKRIEKGKNSRRI